MTSPERSPRGLLLFDIDQTLVNVQPVQEAAFAVALCTAYGVPGKLTDVAFAGKTTPNILREVAQLHGITPAQAEECLPAALAVLAAHVLTALKTSTTDLCFPGVRQLLDALASKPDLVIGVLTGNPPAIGEGILRIAGLHSQFAFCTYGTEASTREDLIRLSIYKCAAHSFPAITADDTVIIGDSCEDVRAARQAGTRVVRVRHATAVPDASQCVPDVLLDGFVPPAVAMHHILTTLTGPSNHHGSMVGSPIAR